VDTFLWYFENSALITAAAFLAATIIHYTNISLLSGLVVDHPWRKGPG
jgi:hypothetical protein